MKCILNNLVLLDKKADFDIKKIVPNKETKLKIVMS